jgi:hypothetical protein
VKRPSPQGPAAVDLVVIEVPDGAMMASPRGGEVKTRLVSLDSYDVAAYSSFSARLHIFDRNSNGVSSLPNIASVEPEHLDRAECEQPDADDREGQPDWVHEWVQAIRHASSIRHASWEATRL